MDLKNNQITVGELLKNPKARAMFAREFPQIMNSPLLAFAKNMTLSSVIGYAKNHLPKEKIKALYEELERI